MEPNEIVEWFKQITPWIDAFSDIVWFLLSDVVLRLLGVLLIIARLTPSESDNRFIAQLISTVNKAVGKDTKQKDQ